MFTNAILTGTNHNTNLQDKKILLGITGSIAAYKAAFLTRLLRKAGAEVQVIMTPSATAFITPLSLATLSARPVYTDVIEGDSWNNHVEMGLWADAMIIAPATAATLSRLAQGLSDNIVIATYLSARCPVFIAPAMDVDMWHHPATLVNVQRLQEYGNQLIPVGHGELASGLVGEGRMAEPEDILTFLRQHFEPTSPLKGKKLLITAGPTYEPIDPVRFIGNRSSGKMGMALAEAAARRGAEVQLILGPSVLKSQHPNINTTRVQTAGEMYEEAIRCFSGCDVAILTAAVADYRPGQAATEKIKKTGELLQLTLERTVDIAANLGKIKRTGQLMIGFALETSNEIDHAKEKLKRKNFDFIVLNSLRDEGAGFAHDTNKISILHMNNQVQHFQLKSKKEVAGDIIREIERLLS